MNRSQAAQAAVMHTLAEAANHSAHATLASAPQRRAAARDMARFAMGERFAPKPHPAPRFVTTRTGIMIGVDWHAPAPHRPAWPAISPAPYTRADKAYALCLAAIGAAAFGVMCLLGSAA